MPTLAELQAAVLHAVVPHRSGPALQSNGIPCCLAGGKIGLIDYGQSKRLSDSYRAAFAQLVRRFMSLCSFGLLPLHGATLYMYMVLLLVAGSLLLHDAAAWCRGAAHVCKLFPPQVLAMDRGKEEEVAAALAHIGVVTEKEDPALKVGRFTEVVLLGGLGCCPRGSMLICQTGRGWSCVGRHC